MDFPHHTFKDRIKKQTPNNSALCSTWGFLLISLFQRKCTVLDISTASITPFCSFPDVVAHHAMAPWPSWFLPLCTRCCQPPSSPSLGSQSLETGYLNLSSSHSQILPLSSSSEQHTLFSFLFGLGIPNSFNHSSSFLEIILELQSAISSQSTTIDSSFLCSSFSRRHHHRASTHHTTDERLFEISAL